MSRWGLEGGPVRVEVRAVGETYPGWGATGLQHLGVHERERHGSLRRAQDRAAYLEAHLLVREVAAALLGCEARELAVVQCCPGCGAEGHGAPSIRDAPGISVSWTHAAGHVAAVAVRGRVCGIDAERAPSAPGFRAPTGALTAGELAWIGRQEDPPVAFARLWTRKENLVKCGVMRLDEAVRTPLVAGDEISTHSRGVRFLERPTAGPVASDERMVVTWALGESLDAR